jgi:hypothetical protein
MSAGSAIMLGLVRPRVPHVQLAGLRVEALHLVLAVHQDSTLFLEVYALTAVLVTMLPVAPALNAQNVAMANTPLSQQLLLVVHQRVVLGNMPIRSQTVVIYVLVGNTHQVLGIRSAQIVLLDGMRLEVLTLHVLPALMVITATPQG